MERPDQDAEVERLRRTQSPPISEPMSWSPSVNAVCRSFTGTSSSPMTREAVELYCVTLPPKGS